MILTLDYLKYILHYNPETGIFTWLAKLGTRCKVGERAGNFTNNYREIRINNKSYKEHRLAWFYMTGEWPKNEVDHKDLNKSNNSWLNLREATRSQNNSNTNVRNNCKTGFKGVYKVYNKFRAQISINGKTKNLGYFDTAEKASKSYDNASKLQFKEFSRGS